MDNSNTVLGQLNGQTQLLIAAVNASISGIIITDYLQPDNPIIYCNPAFEEMTGYLREDVIGKNCRILQGEDREQIGRFILQDAIANGQECNVEIANYRKDGTIFYNELFIAPIRDNAGEITHFIGVQNDITIRKMKEASQHLEFQNIEKLSRQKDAFITSASHELKTPITSLKGTLQLMNRFIEKGHNESEKFAVLSKAAERQTDKLSYIVDDLLSSTAIQHGELPLNKTRFAIAEVIDGCCNHLSMSGGHVIRRSGNEEIEIYADRHKIDQVVINLLDNAVKFSNPSEEIIIDIDSFDAGIRVSIVDKGCGVEDDDKPHIFKQYVRSARAGDLNTGLGLGLFIAAEIVKQHGGEIGMESTVGVGSRFWFTLPFGTN
jgi:PAS domain S-box-containing protein